jgi:hypothetical protein
VTPAKQHETEKRQRNAKLEAAELEDLAWYADDAEETGKARRYRTRARAILKAAGL